MIMNWILIFQSLLNQNINDISIKGVLFMRINENSYSIDPEETNYIQNLPFGIVYISTNDKGIIEIIKLNLFGIPESDFFDELNSNYGKPTRIHIVDEIKLLSDSYNTGEHNITSHTRQTYIKTKDGSLEDKPIYVLWQTSKEEVELIIKREEETSQLKFKVLRS